MSISLLVPATGHSQIYSNSSNVSLAQNATFSLGSIANTASLVLIMAPHDDGGNMNYPSALYMCSYNREPHVIHYHGASWDHEDGGSDFVLYDAGSANVTFKNRSSTTTLFAFHVWNMVGV